VTVKPLYPRRFPLNTARFFCLGLLATVGVFALWARVTDPVTLSLILPYARAYYDADLPHLPALAISRRARPRTITVALPGLAPLEVKPAAAVPVLRDIFSGKTPAQVLAWPLTFSGLFLLWFLILGVRADRRNAARVRRGVQIRGPVLETRAEFNRAVKGGGMGLYVKNRRSPGELLKGQQGFYIRIQKRHEAQGRLVVGDTGTGKTSVLVQTLDQAQEQGRACIVYDPHQQFTPRYFNPDRGDVILNPFDGRCPYYSPLLELDLNNFDAAWSLALSQGLSVFPDSVSGDKARDWFFTKTSRKLWQHLWVKFQPEPHEMAGWMRNELEILARVVGTELETMVPRTSRDQRAAVLSTFAMIADALEMLPRRDEGRPEWSIREWAKTRKGWVFLTNTLQTRESLRPFQSLILDQAILQIASMGERPDLPMVDVVIDEAQTLNRLPQLLPLLTELRKFGMSPTISFQGRSQMKSLYGELSENVFGMPILKYFFRISDKDAAEWAEGQIGKVDLLQVRESQPIRRMRNRNGGSYTEQEVTKPLVSASELQSLPDLTGFMRYGDEGRVVKIKLPNPKEYRTMFGEGRNAPAFVPREGRPVIREEVSPETAAMVAQSMQQRSDRAPIPTAQVPQPNGTIATVRFD
jgi:Type IV secretion-system coupling protein DNA-binding domain